MFNTVTNHGLWYIDSNFAMRLDNRVLGNSKPKNSWQDLTISILLVLFTILFNPPMIIMIIAYSIVFPATVEHSLHIISCNVYNNYKNALKIYFHTVTVALTSQKWCNESETIAFNCMYEKGSYSWRAELIKNCLTYDVTYGIKDVYMTKYICKKRCRLHGGDGSDCRHSQKCMEQRPTNC